MAKKLFILQSNEVQGPFKADDVQRDILLKRWGPGSLIWSSGTSTWTPIEKFDFSQYSEEAPPLPTVSDGDKKWYFEFEGHCDGPFETKEFLKRLAEAPYLRQVRIWGTHLKGWTSPYDCDEVRGVLGIALRGHYRAAVSGSVQVVFTDETRKMTLTTLSEGGFGATGAKDLFVGEIYQVIIESPVLPGKVRANAKYLYSSPDGYAGFQFTLIHQEPLSLVISYVKEHSNKSGGVVVDEKPVWFAFAEGQKNGPLSLKSLVGLISNVSDRNTIQLWKPGMARWAKLDEVSEIIIELEKLESRRGIRAPLIGEIAVQKNGSNFKFEIGTVSVKGVGLKRTSGFKTGDVVEGSIKSRLLNTDIQFRAKVQHVNLSGDCGLEFDGLGDVAQETIQRYLEQFFSVKTDELARVA